MKKAIFIGFLAVILIMSGTVKIAGAAEEGSIMQAGGENPVVLGEDPADVSYSYLYYFTITPCRAHDTRISPGYAISGTWWMNSHLWCSAISTSAKALMANLTAVGMTGPGYLTAYAYGDTNPGTSVLNYGAVSGLPAICNAFILPVNPSYTYEWVLYVYRTTHVVVDIMGYFY